MGLSIAYPNRAQRYSLDLNSYLEWNDAESIVIVQIEHIEAVRNLDEILAVPGLTSIVIGPNDLSGSMDLMGRPRHPEPSHVIGRAH